MNICPARLRVRRSWVRVPPGAPFLTIMTNFEKSRVFVFGVVRATAGEKGNG